MNYKLLKTKIYNREEYILRCAKDKTVLHLGAAQANDRDDFSQLEAHVKGEKFLHRSLCKVAKQCVGVDYNKNMVKKLRNQFGIEGIVFGNLEDQDSLSELKGTYDLIVMGELIEHLANPGVALKNITHLMSDNTKLLITTPNALAVRNFLFVLLGFEAHDQDHVAMYTPRLLDRILDRSGLRVEEYNYYQSTFDGRNRGVFTNYWHSNATSFKSIVGKISTNIFLRIHPGYSDGIIVTCGKS